MSIQPNQKRNNRKDEQAPETEPVRDYGLSPAERGTAAEPAEPVPAPGEEKPGSAGAAEPVPAAGADRAEAAPAPEVTSLRDRDCFQSRELSWLQFNLRVLSQAGDRRVPLLERLKFLSIYYSNLDEFFMVRVGALIHRAILLPDEVSRTSGRKPAAELKKVLQAVEEQNGTAEAVWRLLVNDLKAAGIEVPDLDRPGRADEAAAKKVFAELRPLMETQIVDAGHPFPFLAGGETAVAVLLHRPGKADRIGLVSLCRLPDFRVLEKDGVQKVLITAELVRHYAAQLFPGDRVMESALIRLTRNADVFPEKLEAAGRQDARAGMKKLLRRRKSQQPVRLQVSRKLSRDFRDLLLKELKPEEGSIFVSKVPYALGFGRLVKAGPECRYEPRQPVRSSELHKGQYFRYLEKHDLLLSFPYQSMDPFVDLLYEAADDPGTLSVCITLYRLAVNSKVAAALAYAAGQGKDVLCLLELRARFDEQNNIDYSELLEKAGCTVIYGLPDKKVHSKLCLITRRFGEGLHYITQIGTGNYNEVTGEQYCDLSLITGDEATGRDAAAVFEALALGETPGPAEKLWVAPESYKSRLTELLDRERAKGPQGHVILKVNSMNDVDVMRKLMECSAAGVEVELLIRGICCLLPGIPGKTENIRVKSVVGRYLEHSRIFVFGSGEDQRVFIGSGDLLNRNTRRRVEVFTEVTAPETREQVMAVVEAFRQDKVGGWVMRPDGSYRRPEGIGTGSQDALYEYFSQRIIRADKPAAKASGKKRPGLWARLVAWWKSLW